MRPFLPVRILVAAASALAVSAGSLAIASPAGAVDYTICNSLSGVNISGQTEMVSGCTGPTGGSGVIAGPLTSPMTVNWANGGTTSITFTAKTRQKSKKCPAGSTQVGLSGQATGSTGPAEHIRGMFYMATCVDPNENLSLVPGKEMKVQTQ
jgi:hypothetical protein